MGAVEYEGLMPRVRQLTQLLSIVMGVISTDYQEGRTGQRSNRARHRGVKKQGVSQMVSVSGLRSPRVRSSAI